MTFEQEPPLTAPVVAPQVPPVAPQASRKIFTGPFGLRAGWGILLYMVLVAVLGVFVSFATLAAKGKLKQTLQHTRNHKSETTTSAKPPSAKSETSTKREDNGVPVKPTLIGESETLACLALAALCLAKIERRDIGIYGIGKRRIADFLPGAVSGLATLSLLVFVLYACHLLVFDTRLLFGRAAFLSGAAWLLAFFFVGCLEEYLFRGYIQFTLTRGLFGLAQRMSPAHARGVAFILASVLTSLLFFMAHTSNGGENALGLVAVFLAGVVLTYALWRTGSLWWGIGFHTAWDWAQSFLYGVPDSGNLSAGRLFQTHAAGNPALSGGSDGPEGSVLVIPALLIILLILHFTPSGSQPALESHLPQPVPLSNEDVAVA